METCDKVGGVAVPANRKNCRRLLVIDRDPQFAALVRRTGESLGYIVETTSQVRDLEWLYDRFSPSVIVYDFFTRGMDGIELVNWLHQRDSKARVLLTSAKDSFYLRAARELAAARGRLDVDFLVEPLSETDTGELLARHLSDTETA